MAAKRDAVESARDAEFEAAEVRNKLNDHTYETGA